MGKSSGKSNIPVALRCKLHDILKSNASEPGRPLFVGKPGQEVSIQIPQYTKIATLHSSLARINEEADPIGFLISAANGALFPVHYVVDNNGEPEIVTEYHSFNLEQRERIHRFLANKLVPTISVSKVIPNKTKAEAAETEEDQADTSFLNMVRNAAGKAKQLERRPVIDIEIGANDQEIKAFADVIGEGK